MNSMHQPLSLTELQALLTRVFSPDALGEWALLLACLAAGFGLALSDPAPLVAAGLVVLGVGGIAVIVNGTLARRLVVGIDLDASGRWVTLSGVHPAFAAACDTRPTPTDAAARV